MDKIKVMIDNRQKDIKIPTGLRLLVRRTCHAVLTMEDFQGSAEISVSFVNDEQIRELNAKFRGKDMPTDVLSFPMTDGENYEINPNTGAKILGDIIISVERAFEQSERFGHSFQREMGFLTAHSMLHLLGYDHENGGLEAVTMREKEEEVLVQLGLPRNSIHNFNDNR